MNVDQRKQRKEYGQEPKRGYLMPVVVVVIGAAIVLCLGVYFGLFIGKLVF